MWSTGTAWGSVAIDDGEARITVLGGELNIDEISIGTVTVKAHATDHFGGKPERHDDRSTFKTGMGLMIRHADIIVSDKPAI